MTKVAYSFEGNQTGEENNQGSGGYSHAESGEQKPAEQPEVKKEEQPANQAEPQKQEVKPEEKKADEPADSKKDEAKPEEKKAEQPTQSEIDDAKVLEFLRKKNPDFKGESVEDLFKKPEAPAQPEKKYDESTQKFLEYQERTGRGIEDYMKLNQDLSKMSPLETAFDKIRKDATGVDLDEKEVRFLLENELGFDPSGEMDEQEKAKFKKFYGSHLNTLKQEQQKFNDPVDGYEPKTAEQKASQPDNGGEKVQLSNGQEVDAGEYEKQRQEYLKMVEENLPSIKDQKFTFAMDGKDGKQEFDINYEMTEEDLHGVKSDSEDLGSLLNPYQTESGFDMKSLQEDLFWRNKARREKAFSAMARQVRSQVIAEITNERKNVNFNSPGSLPNSKKNDGYEEPGGNSQQGGMGVKYPFPQN